MFKLHATNSALAAASVPYIVVELTADNFDFAVREATRIAKALSAAAYTKFTVFQYEETARVNAPVSVHVIEL